MTTLQHVREVAERFNQIAAESLRLADSGREHKMTREMATIVAALASGIGFLANEVCTLRANSEVCAALKDCCTPTKGTP